MIPLPILLTLLAAASHAAGPSALRAGPVPGWIEAGIERIYDMDLGGAEREFAKILAADPEHPDGHYGMAAASWMRVEYGPRRGAPELEAEFQRRIEVSIAKSRAWLDRRPRDADALLTLGGAYGMRSRRSLSTGRWIMAVVDGRRALAATRAAVKADPALYDAYLGIGMWEYYADVFPRIIKALGKMVLGGDRKLGLEHVRLAAERGRFVRITAQLILIEIYLEDRFGDRDPAAALAMVRRLRAAQPMSPLFRQIEQVCLYASGDYEGSLKASEEYLRRIDALVPNYEERERPRMHVGVGMARWRLKDLAGAREALERAAALAGRVPSPGEWGAWGLLKLAQVLDAQGRRAEAVMRYRAVLAAPDLWGLHAAAKRHLKKPFPKDGDPGPLPPP